MALKQGEQLGHYRIQSLIGQGGMGEVYRARDSRLERDVAIKVLPQSVSQNSERLARFEREAKVLAALNHPNIASIYGVEHNALVMELVEGETLPRGVDLETALRYAAQIAEALEAAHEKGIVHRDLKPANIKITSDGTVKVLDFGLATAVHQDREPGDPALSPTLSMTATEAGVILGTAAYMSPEQAAGKRVDKRSDIWSFGVVLWEMLSGKRLFGSGDSISLVLADVLRSPIDFDQLNASVPAPIIELLRRCLDRDLKTRLRDIGEARIAISKYLANPKAFLVEAPTAKKSFVAWTVAALFALIAAALSVAHFRGAASPLPALQMQIATPVGTPDPEIAISPDGHYLAMAITEQGKSQLWLRSLTETQARMLPGTEGALYPFWSPDSRYIGFFANGKLQKTLASGGPPQVISEALDGRGATWNRDDSILFSSDDGGGFTIRRVAATGGTPKPEYKAPRGITRYPFFLPDGKHFLYVVTRSSAEENGIYFRSSDGSVNTRVLPDESSVVFASGRLLFIRQKTLIAQPFDPDSGKIAGDPVQIAANVSPTSNVIYAPITASDGGILIYQSGGSLGRVELVWFDRSGKRGETIGAPGSEFEPAISPDGKSIAYTRLSTEGSDIWIWDVVRSTERRFTTDPSFEVCPMWSPNSDRIVFRSNRNQGIADLYQKAVAGGEDELLFKNPTRKTPTQWTRGGKLVVFNDTAPATKEDIWTMPIEDGKLGMPAVFLHSEFVETHAQLSPDGNWMAYTSNESGASEVYVRAFPSGGDPKKISKAGGQESRWRADGKELYFMSLDGKMMAVSIKLGAGSTPMLEAGTPEALFPVPPVAHYNSTGFSYDVTPDGKRFLMAVASTSGTASAALNVILSWDKPRP